MAPFLRNRFTAARIGAWVLLAALLGWTTGCGPSQHPGTSPTPLVWTNPKDNSELVFVPAGKFIMGSDTDEIDEAPQQQVDLAGFWIGKNLVTNEQFVDFLNHVGNKTVRGVPWLMLGPAFGQVIRENEGGHFSVLPRYRLHPVAGVSWNGAEAYCKWVDARLPTEAEWEKAARGADGRKYPWGNEWNPQAANADLPDQPFNLTLPRETTPVGAHLQGVSPFGCLDMAGNVWEWCSSLYAQYPYNPHDGRERLDVVGPRVIRGGCWNRLHDFARCSNRYRIYPYFSELFDNWEASNTGFRIARSHTPADTMADSAHASPLSDSNAQVHRMSHPNQMGLVEKERTPPSEQSDNQYRLKRGFTYRAGAILGYPATRQREARYPVSRERLYDLERPTRDITAAELIQWMRLRKGDVAADIGAGAGSYTALFSSAVGPTGKVFATDISLSALRYLQQRMHDADRWRGSSGNVYLVLADVTDCLLPRASVDLAFMSETHYFFFPRAQKGASPPLAQVVHFYRSIRQSLKKDGRLVVFEVNHRPPQNDPDRGTLSVEEIRAELGQAGLRMAEHTQKPVNVGPPGHKRQWVYNLMVFRPVSSAAVHGAGSKR